MNRIAMLVEEVRIFVSQIDEQKQLMCGNCLSKGDCNLEPDDEWIACLHHERDDND